LRCVFPRQPLSLILSSSENAFSTRRH
jgi:hypothetical protein